MPSKRESPSDDSNVDHISPPDTPSKQTKTTSTTSSTPSKSVKATLSKSPKKDRWSPEKRLRLFSAYESIAQIKWDEVASKVGEGTPAKSCREQWQRAMGSKIRKALSEE